MDDTAIVTNAQNPTFGKKQYCALYRNTMTD